MKDIGLMHYFLVLEVWEYEGKFIVSHGKYALEILHKFHMDNRKPMDTPLATNRRKDNVTSGEEVDACIYR